MELHHLSKIKNLMTDYVSSAVAKDHNPQHNERNCRKEHNKAEGSTKWKNDSCAKGNAHNRKAGIRTVAVASVHSGSFLGIGRKLMAVTSCYASIKKGWKPKSRFFTVENWKGNQSGQWDVWERQKRTLNSVKNKKPCFSHDFTILVENPVETVEN